MTRREIGLHAALRDFDPGCDRSGSNSVIQLGQPHVRSSVESGPRRTGPSTRKPDVAGNDSGGSPVGVLLRKAGADPVSGSRAACPIALVLKLPQSPPFCPKPPC